MLKKATFEDIFLREVENNDFTISDLEALIKYTQEKKRQRIRWKKTTKPKEDQNTYSS